MDAQTLRDCADHIADNISKAIDSIGPIELGPDTQTAIIISGMLHNTGWSGLSEQNIADAVEQARKIQKEIRRQR